MNGLLNHSFTHLFINSTYIDFVSCARHLLNPEDTALSKQEKALVCKEVTDSKKMHVKQETISFQCSKAFIGNIGAHSKDTTSTLGLQLGIDVHNASKRIMGMVQICT